MEGVWGDKKETLGAINGLKDTSCICFSEGRSEVSSQTPPHVLPFGILGEPMWRLGRLWRQTHQLDQQHDMGKEVVTSCCLIFFSCQRSQKYKGNI